MSEWRGVSLVAGVSKHARNLNGQYLDAREKETFISRALKSAHGHANGRQKKAVTLPTKPFDHRSGS
jgi:hypothetical protein